jgi:hypothetical protein
MAAFQLFLKSGWAKDLSAPLYKREMSLLSFKKADFPTAKEYHNEKT